MVPGCVEEYDFLAFVISSGQPTRMISPLRPP
jgi:hypothetical protein